MLVPEYPISIGEFSGEPKAPQDPKTSSDLFMGIYHGNWWGNSQCSWPIFHSRTGNDLLHHIPCMDHGYACFDQ